MPEGIGKAQFQRLLKTLPLLIGKPCVAPIGSGIFQVNFPMGHIQVAADDHWLLAVQFRNFPAKGFVPFHPVVNSGQLPLGVGGVAGHQEELWIFQGNHSALVVQLRHSQTVRDGQGLLPGKYGGAGISLFLGIIPIHVVIRQGKGQLPGGELGLLQAEKVGVCICKILHKAFFHTGPQTVYIPGYEFHERFLICFLYFSGCYSHPAASSCPGG